MQEYHDLNEISLQERLERCDAELKGLSLVMGKLLKNIAVYSDFLEDELDGSESGERYLDKLRHDVQQIKTVFSTTQYRAQFRASFLPSFLPCGSRSSNS